MDRTRRAFLAATSGVAVGFAGCAGDGGGDGETTTTTTTADGMGDTTTTTTTADGMGDTTTTTTAETTTDDTTANETTENDTTANETTTTTEETTTTAARDVSVAMVNTSFDPLRAQVAVGWTVTWTNEDSYGHNVESAQFHDAAESWDYASGTVTGGESVEYTFESAGVYEYVCTIHGEGSMCGVVLVGDATLDADLPCESGSGY